VKFNVSERIRLVGILPDKGNILTLKIVRTLRGDLSFSEKELKDWEIKSEDNRITWNNKVKEKEVEVGDTGKKLIVDILKDLDEKNELTVADITLWDKLVGEDK
jgi:hypothetical protein